MDILGVLKKHSVNKASIATHTRDGLSTYSFGDDVDAASTFQIASLSKTLSAYITLNLLSQRDIELNTLVQELIDLPPALRSKPLTVRHLLQHTALNLHYVNGYSESESFPDHATLLASLEYASEPGEAFHYSGGGFILLHYLLEELSGTNIIEMEKGHFSELTLDNLPPKNSVPGTLVSGEHIQLRFPACAAGGYGTARGLIQFLKRLSDNYQSGDARAQLMLSGEDKGSIEFIGAEAGLGIFILEGGENRWMLHHGANDGYRAIFLYCFDGPDRDTGIAVLASGDHYAVPFVAEVVQRFLKEQSVAGIDFDKFQDEFRSEGTSQESLVNKGYKELIFNAFQRS